MNEELGMRNEEFSTWMLAPWLLLFCPLAALLLSGCERRELTYYPEEGQRVSVDWSLADLDEESHYGATLIFYPRDGGKPVTVLMGDRHQTTVNLPSGRHYDVLLFNRSFADFGAIAFRSEDAFHTLEAYARQVENRSDSRAIVHAPEKLAVDAVEDFEVGPEMHFAPRKLTQTIEVKIHVQGLKNIHEAVCTMNGLPVSVLLATGRVSAETASHTFELDGRSFNEGSSSDGTLTGRFNVFGFDAGVRHELEFTALLKDGKTEVQHKFPEVSITETEDSKGNIVLNVDAVAPDPIPDVDMGGSGLDAEVGGWEDGENAEIEM